MKYLFILAFIFSFLSCGEKDDNIITDPGGFSEFYINNKSDKNLNSVFILSDDYTNRQETQVINAKESEKIFEGGSITNIPLPNEVFNQLKFYSVDSNPEELLLTISPILNSDWKIIDKEETPQNYDLYELVITNELLN